MDDARVAFQSGAGVDGGEEVADALVGLVPVILGLGDIDTEVVVALDLLDQAVIDQTLVTIAIRLPAEQVGDIHQRVVGREPEGQSALLLDGTVLGL